MAEARSAAAQPQEIGQHRLDGTAHGRQRAAWLRGAVDQAVDRAVMGTLPLHRHALTPARRERVPPYPRSVSASCLREAPCVTSCYRCRAGNIRLPAQGSQASPEEGLSIYSDEYIVKGAERSVAMAEVIQAS